MFETLPESKLRKLPSTPPTLKTWLATPLLFLAFVGLLALVARIGVGMFEPFLPPAVMPEGLDLSPERIPYYLGRSTLRMFIALPFSLLFSLIYGYVAAHSPRVERLMVPLLDILQSVPVLGFLSVTVTGFIALFKGSLLGLEAASIFAVFTAQAWNMTFAFYQSIRALSDELREACRLYQLGRWQTFKKLELPSATIPLVWNTMMSFGGGWFFVSASEAISVLNTQYTLPGIGSYAALAIKAQNLPAILYAIAAIAAMIVVTDQLLWRPLIAWSHRFKVEQTEASVRQPSWVYELIQVSKMSLVMRRLSRLLGHVTARFQRPFKPLSGFTSEVKPQSVLDKFWSGTLFLGTLILAGAGIHFITSSVSIKEIRATIGLGLLTFLRVTLLVIVSSVVWIPLGVKIGFNPRLARLGQPLALFFASFPANFLFPFATALFIRWSLPIDVGSAVLMALGTQWYVLFNVIGGAQAIPTDLREMAENFGMKGWQRWKTMILPAILPFWVTGAVTAAGGAWNASIVAEIVSWGDTTLEARGLGAYIAKATGTGDWPRIALGVGTMCLFVVALNRLFWRRLYNTAVSKYAL